MMLLVLLLLLGELEFVSVPNSESGLGQQVIGSDYDLWVGLPKDYSGDRWRDAVIYRHSGSTAVFWDGNSGGSFAYRGEYGPPYWVTPTRDAPNLHLLPRGSTLEAVDGYNIKNKLYVTNGSGGFKDTGILLPGLPLDLLGNHQNVFFQQDGQTYSISPDLALWGHSIPTSVSQFALWYAGLTNPSYGPGLGWPAGVEYPPVHPLDAKYSHMFNVTLIDPKNPASPSHIVVHFAGDSFGQWVDRTFILERKPGDSGPGAWRDATESLGLPSPAGNHFLIPGPFRNDGLMHFVDGYTGSLFVNDLASSGRFTEVPNALFPAGTGPRGDRDGATLVADLGNNGAVDVVFWKDHGVFAKDYGVFLGNGDGTFTESTGTIPGSHRDCALVDLNNDGKLDLISAQRNGTERGRR